MAKPEHIWKLNGMKLILDLRGLPDKICQSIKKIELSPWLRMDQKVRLIDNVHKNYLTEKNTTHITLDMHLERFN